VKIFSRRAHGVVDYALVVAFLSAPTALGFTGGPRTLSYSLAFLHLVITAFSSFPPGGLPFLPYRFHSAIELTVGLFLVVSPWILGFADQFTARSCFLLLGALMMVIAVFTDFDRRRKVVPPPPGDRRRWFARRSG